MSKSQTKVHIYGEDELIDNITNSVVKEVKKELAKTTSEKRLELINRKGVSKLFGISLPTVDSWRKANIIVGYRIGNRLMFKLSELEQALTKINQ